MAETNGDGRIEDHEERLRKLEAARKDMEDTMIVMAHLESKAGARIKEHAEFIADHEDAMRRHDKAITSLDAYTEAHRISMQEFDEKLNALIEIVGRMQGGIESHP
jgi:hypothetical protein